MKSLVGSIVFVSILAGCAASADTTVPASSAPIAEQGETGEMMAAALFELITKDNTFGLGPPPFTSYRLLTHLDPFAGDPMGGADEPTRSLTAAERAAIEEVVRRFGPVQWIDDPTGFRTGGQPGPAILGVGEPVIEGDTGLVPVSLWCGDLCGTWLTYRVDFLAGAWAATGKEGPVAIS